LIDFQNSFVGTHSNKFDQFSVQILQLSVPVKEL